MLTPDLIINQRVKQLSPWLLLRSGWAASAAKGSKQDASPSTQSHCVPRAGNACPHPIPAPGMSQLSLMGEIQLGAATSPRAKGEQGRKMVMTTGSRTGWAGPLALAVQAPEAVLPLQPQGHRKCPSPATTHRHHPHHFPPETQEHC